MDTVIKILGVVVVGFFVVLGIITAVVATINGIPISGSTTVAEMVCESHNMRLISHDGTDEIVCEKNPEPNENRKVFLFEE